MQNLVNGLSNRDVFIGGTGSTVAITVSSGSPDPTGNTQIVEQAAVQMGTWLSTHGIGVLSITEMGQLAGYTAASILIIKIVYKQAIHPLFAKVLIPLYKWSRSLFR